MGTTPPTQCSESILTGSFPQLSAESCECESSRTVRQRVPSDLVQLSAALRQVAACFCSSVSRDLPRSAQFSLDFPRSFRRTFRIKFPQDFPHKASAGFSAGFPHRRVQRIAAKVLENPVPLVGPQGRRVLRGPTTLQKLVRQTVREQMLTNRATENFPTGFRRGPLFRAPLVSCRIS